MTAEDIPSDRRHHLKQLSHELAGALLFNLGTLCTIFTLRGVGMEPTNVFAMGHTSHLIGNTIQVGLFEF